jgi:hypothetical protein
MTKGAPIDRPLNDDERQLLAALAVRELAQQAGCSLELARDVLAEQAGKGEILFVGNAETFRVANSAGGWLVEAARDWLAFHASWPEVNQANAATIVEKGKPHGNND